MYSLMRNPLHLLAIAALPALGCNIPSYVIEENVTVPPEVQREFSASTPGFVMNRDFIYGVLCSPTTEPVVFHAELFRDHEACEKNRDNQDEISGTAYAFRPTESELLQIDARSRTALACGETAPVDDKSVRTDVYLLNLHDNLPAERQIAVGTSKGECVSSSRYVVNITLALK